MLFERMVGGMQSQRQCRFCASLETQASQVKDNLCKVEDEIYLLDGLLASFENEKENRLLLDLERFEKLEIKNDLRMALRNEDLL